MAGITLFNTFLMNLAEGLHDLSDDPLKIMLTNVAPTPTMTGFSDLTEIASGNGYTAGGSLAAIVSSTQTAGVYKLILGDVTFTAAGGPIGPFRYVVLYNDTGTAKPLIGFSDYGVNYTLPDGQPFTVDFDDAAGVLSLAAA